MKSKMMKIRMLGALFAVFASSALAVASASATLWLINSRSTTPAVSVTLHGLWLWHHKGGFIGNFLVHCTGLLDGLVGATILDLITEVLGLKGEENQVACEFSEHGSCGSANGEKVTVGVVGLTWHTLLELTTIGGKAVTIDHYLSTSGHEPGFEITCPALSMKVTCKGLDYAIFEGNGTNGALFEFPGEAKVPCTDGGEGTLLGLVELLGAVVS